MTFSGDLSITSTFDGDMSISGVYDGDLGIFQKVIEVDTYTGPTEATPGASEQIFATAGKMMTENFTVHAVPANYGMITWNGSTITVS